jgi:diacylglycerol kinase family enzyme
MDAAAMAPKRARDLLGDEGGGNIVNGWLAVANAYSGGRDGKRAGIAQAMCAMRPTVRDAVFSEYRGHARKIASQASGYAGIVAVGGDGTLLEILNGIDRERQELAILPAGRGNSLARDLGLHGIAFAVDTLAHGRIDAIDLAEATLTGESGEQTQIVSASTIAIGYPVAATALANRMKYLGRFCYAAAATLASASLKAMSLEVAYDGRSLHHRRLAGLIISNTRHLANFVAFPNADWADGRLDVMEMCAGPVVQNARNLSALCGVDLCAPAPIEQVHTVRLRFALPADVMIDGEIFDRLSALEVRILPGALRCRRTLNV